MRKSNNKQKQTISSSLSGYSLVELAITLTLVAIIGGGLLSTAGSKQDAEQSDKIMHQLDAIEAALLKHVVIKGYLPCPASRDTVESSSTHGVADCDSGTGITSVGSNMEEVLIGVVPVRTLNLPGQYLYDSWGGRITYAMIRRLGGNATFMAGYATSATNGVIQIIDNGSPANQMHEVNADTVIAYALVSHGKDKKGAFSRSGNELEACTAGTPEADGENCDFLDLNPGNRDAIFRDIAINESDVEANYFHDFVRWMPLDELQQDAGTEEEEDPNDVADIDIYDSSACVIDSLNRSYCWGRNDDGQLGDDSTTDSTTPVQVYGGYTNWDVIATGHKETCAIRAGRLWCWGDNYYGQLGNNDATHTDEDSPVLVYGGYSDWVDVDMGKAFGCGLRNSGKIYCWGRNSQGNLGQGTDDVHSDIPLQVGTENDWEAIATGNYHACGIRRGQMWCWGYNSQGAIGQGHNTTPETLPLQVESATDWFYVTAGDKHTCGLRGSEESGGSAWCWGKNSKGGLGDNTIVDANLPQQVDGAATDWTSLSGGYNHTCGIRNGNAYCWGGDVNGSLGNGGSDSQAETPQQVSGSHTDWMQLSAGKEWTCGRRNNGELYCWGGQSYGLGDGSGTVNNVPLLIPGITTKD